MPENDSPLMKFLAILADLEDGQRAENHTAEAEILAAVRTMVSHGGVEKLEFAIACKKMADDRVAKTYA